MGIENKISELYEMLFIVFVPMFLVGSLNCFFGYKLHKAINCILGFVYGAVLGIVLAVLADWGDAAIFIALIMGVVGAFLANIFYIIGVFISSFFTGFIIGVLTMILSKSYTSMIGVGVVCGLLFGLIACFAIKHMVIIVTAFMGSIQMSLILILLFRNVWIGVMAAIVLFALGILTQYTLTKKKREVSSTESQPMKVASQEAIGNTQTVNSMSTMNETLEKSNQKTLRSLFSDDIYQEIKYVFSHVDTSRIIYMPILGEENWICTCGNENTSDDCIYCGINKNDLQEKINYQFLKQHKEERIKNLEKERELKKEQFAEDINKTIISAKSKTTEMVEKTKTYNEKYCSILDKKRDLIWKKINKWMICVEDFFMKYRKITMPIVTGLILISSLVYFVVHNPTCRMAYFNYKGDHAKEYYERVHSYMSAVEEKENLHSYLSLIEFYCEHTEYSQVVKWNEEAKKLYADNPEYQSVEEKFKPEKPQINLEEGVYEERINIAIDSFESDYYATLYYSINGQDKQAYNEPIALNESGEYTVTAWVENAVGYVSESVNKTYKISLPIPDSVVFSLEGGYFTKTKKVKLSAEEDTIYYTLDGTQPTKDSMIYEKAISCGFGTTTIKAVCFNELGVPSEIVTNTYYISYPDSASTTGANAYSGYFYDYMYEEDHLTFYDKQTGEERHRINTASRPNEFEGYLYYISDGNILSRCDLSNMEEHVVNTDIQVGSIIVVHGCIYYVDIDRTALFRMNLDGTENTNILNGFVYGMSRDGNDLYCVTKEQGVLKIPEKNGEIQTVLTGNITDFCSVNGKNYYVQDGNLYCAEGENVTTVFERKADETYTKAKGLHDGYRNVYEEYCTRIYGNHKLMVVVINESNTYTEYEWWMDEEDGQISNQSQKRYMLLNVKTGELIDFSRNQIFLADDAYYEFTDEPEPKWNWIKSEY